MKVTTMTQTIYKQLFEGSLSPLTMKEEKAYFTLARESGLGSMLKVVLLVLAAAILGSSALHGIFALFGA